MGALTEIVERQAREAWSALQPALGEPERIDLLKGRKERKTVCRLVGAGPSRTDVIAKRYRLSSGRIERAIYDDVLPRLPLPSLRCYGLAEEANGTRCWLFLEDAAGEPYSIALEEHRRLAGHWLGFLHTSVPGAPTAPLSDHGPSHYLERLRTTRAVIVASRANPAIGASHTKTLNAIDRQLDVLEERWELVEQRCAAMPRTVVHGDFVPKNLHVRSNACAPALLCFDWACGGWGSPAVDLAQAPSSSDRFSASPDLAAYWSVVRDHWPTYSLRSIEEWANIGSMFRALASMCWASRSLASEWVDEPITEMRVAQSLIGRAVRTARWWVCRS
jgi:hypothetical protein